MVEVEVVEKTVWLLSCNLESCQHLVIVLTLFLRMLQKEFQICFKTFIRSGTVNTIYVTFTICTNIPQQNSFFPWILLFSAVVVEYFYQNGIMRVDWMHIFISSRLGIWKIYIHTEIIIFRTMFIYKLYFKPTVGVLSNCESSCEYIILDKRQYF